VQPARALPAAGLARRGIAYYAGQSPAPQVNHGIAMAIEANPQPVDFRARARFAVQHEDEALAESAYARVLDSEPGDVEALQFLAHLQLVRGFAHRAVEMLQVAAQAHPDVAGTWHQLGASQMMDGDLRGAAESLRRALQLGPQMFVARLRLGTVLEQLGESHQALVEYFGAINVAQGQGRWLSEETTAPGIREAVKHAIRYVDAGRHALFEQTMEPLRQRYGRAEMARVDQALAIYLGEQPANIPDPRQKPKFLYFPGVPSRTYYARENFPWYAQLEASTDIVREELRQVLLEAQDDLESFLGGPAGDLPGLLKGSGKVPASWDAFFFFRHSERFDEHLKRCPHTAALLHELPLVRVRAHAPEALFSVLRPGSHILPHRGVTNTRLVTHLPLIVPPDCAIRVGGEIHAWQEGRAVTFDDTMEHEAWNRSGETRVVMILDCWNPDMTEAEQGAITELVGAIGDFNAASRVAMPTG
jgi:aspartate beta-hydroxylase